MTELTTKQISHLRTLAHRLAPLLKLGKQGASDGFRQQLDAALERQELVKVQLGKAVELEAEELAAALGATLVQKVGRMRVFFRRSSPPKLELPR